MLLIATIDPPVKIIVPSGFLNTDQVLKMTGLKIDELVNLMDEGKFPLYIPVFNCMWERKLVENHLRKKSQ